MQSETNKRSAEEKSLFTESVIVKPADQSLVETSRAIVFHPTKGRRIDSSMVHFQYYNSFNYTMLTNDRQRVRLTVGVTSANPGEGKTLVASNLAVSLALGYRRKTVLVDLNIHRPRLHEIFGAPMGAGLLEAMQQGDIQLFRTTVDQLSVLTVGALRLRKNSYEPVGNLIGLEHLGAFGEVISALEKEFDFVIVDLPAINTRNFPILFTNHLNGLLVVVDVTKTRKEDLDTMFRQVNEQQVLGFVMNRVRDDGA